jgi:hypothetical protein
MARTLDYPIDTVIMSSGHHHDPLLLQRDTNQHIRQYTRLLYSLSHIIMLMTTIVSLQMIRIMPAISHTYSELTLTAIEPQGSKYWRKTRCKIDRAASAAPTYFGPINIGTKKTPTGEWVINKNPDQLMLDEVSLAH